MTASSMRVLHVLSADLWAGAAVQVYHTLTDLRRRNVDVRVALFNDGVFARRLDVEQIAWTLFDEKRLSPAAMASGLSRFIRDVEPACIHVHAYKEHILAVAGRRLAKRRRIPIVRTLHGRTQVARLRGLRLLRARGVEAVERFLLRRSVLIAVSADLQEHLRKAYPRARVELVPNGVCVPAMSRSAVEVRRRWGVPEDAFWVGCVARLEPVKNLSCLVRAAAMLGPAVPKLRVSIFGTGSQQHALEALTAALGVTGIVTLHGFEEDMPTTTSAFDCFALTSFDEGMPMSLLEAMALGVPPVCSAVGGVRELIRDGETGLLFESDNHADLAAALARVRDSEQLARRIGDAARDFVRGSFSIGVTNAALLKVYRSLIGESAVSETVEGRFA